MTIMKSTRKSASRSSRWQLGCAVPGSAESRGPTAVRAAGLHAPEIPPQNQVADDYTNAQTAGDLNILAIGWNDEGANITNATDSAGNTDHGRPTFRGGGLSQAIHHATDILSGSNTVTVTFDQPAKDVDLRATEHPG